MIQSHTYTLTHRSLTANVWNVKTQGQRASLLNHRERHTAFNRKNICACLYIAVCVSFFFVVFASRAKFIPPFDYPHH